MKGKGLVVILIMCLGLLVACTQEITPSTKQMAPSSDQGFLVRIAPNGKIVNAVNWDGSEVKYEAGEKRRITDARLAFFEQEGEPSHYLKKVDGKWQKTAWAQEPSGGPDDIVKGIIVHVGPDGTISRITNMDGSEVQYSESIDLKKVRIATKNTCCYGNCGGFLCCQCRYCPGGKCT